MKLSKAKIGQRMAHINSEATPRATLIGINELMNSMSTTEQINNKLPVHSPMDQWSPLL